MRGCGAKQRKSAQLLVTGGSESDGGGGEAGNCAVVPPAASAATSAAGAAASSMRQTFHPFFVAAAQAEVNGTRAMPLARRQLPLEATISRYQLFAIARARHRRTEETEDLPPSTSRKRKWPSHDGCKGHAGDVSDAATAAPEPPDVCHKTIPGHVPDLAVATVQYDKDYPEGALPFVKLVGKKKRRRKPG